jgi:hypothetical protein
MYTGRVSHAAVYHSQYLYVLGGYSGGCLRECERYSCEENRWEVLPALPVAGFAMSAVEVENSVYALGGTADEATTSSSDTFVVRSRCVSSSHLAKGSVLVCASPCLSCGLSARDLPHPITIAYTSPSLLKHCRPS